MSSAARLIRAEFTTALLGLCLLAAAPTAQLALAGVDRPHCDVCGRYTDKSPCRIKATERIGKHGLDIDVCSLFCYAERLEDVKGEITSTQVLDFTTLDDDAPVMLKASTATYLYGTSGDEEATAKPFILAFGSKKAAESARKIAGGELLSWDDVLAKCQKLAAEYEPPKPEDGYTPLKKRGRNPR